MKTWFLMLAIFTLANAHAQQFIKKAVIEYEVKANIQKTMGQGLFEEKLKENLPQFKIAYYTFTFADNKSLYKLDHWSTLKYPDFLKKNEEYNDWYFDFNIDKYEMQKNIFGTEITVEDSIPKIKWKITNDSRVIAGFNCRKAVAVIFDSVYVFAFYTDEIMISGGPCSLHGLPGMILGVTIPRLYTSWIATKVMLNGIDESAIKPVEAKKHYDLKFLESTIKDSFKGWYSDDASENEEIKQQKDRYLWGILL